MVHRSPRTTQRCSGLSVRETTAHSRRSLINQVQFAIKYELGDVDKHKRVRHCLWFREFVHDNPRILDITWFSDEAWFHLSGYVNAQNSRIWASENPHEIANPDLTSPDFFLWGLLKDGVCKQTAYVTGFKGQHFG
ncbi:hypothetical protein B7P43_G06549 [Cryptotermes secundus]|uniref:DUF4817 domain-containing protein n=1 Tax=Cryptotermes secundus TaxID=105785 RepID=A0A2J7QTV2_9NEOP|nr:hypothetical protein B7P43_G06549 [Cryptotermes secundus]